MSPDPPVSLWPDPDALGALTDLYQLTMMAGYYALGMEQHRATFELFVRRLPPGRAYLVFAGLEQAIRDVQHLAFSRAQVEAIRRLPVFAHTDPSFFERLSDFRFEGDVWAVPEGTVIFAGEPLVRVEASLPQAQLVETLLLASLGYPTLVASKAARVVDAAQGRPVFDFGLRRGHGPHAGLLGALASGPSRRVTSGNEAMLVEEAGRFDSEFPRREPWRIPGSRRAEMSRRRSRGSRVSSLMPRRCSWILTTRKTASASPRRSNQPCRRSVSTAATWPH